MKTLAADVAFDLRVRCGPSLPDSAGQADEADSRYRDETWRLSANRTALVLVDVWDRHRVLSHQQRASAIVAACLVPLVEAARSAGILVVHAPSRLVAAKYPESRGLLPLELLARAAALLVALDQRLGRLRGRQRDPLAAAPRVHPPEWAEIDAATRIAAPLQPRGGDVVVRSGAHLHRVLRRRRVCHLLYAGFATNLCVRRTRTYSMEQMARRGYTAILVRDGTTGLENAETLQEMLLTRAAIIETEQAFASASAADLLQAFASVSA